jgi:hypothetical protein
MNNESLTATHETAVSALRMLAGIVLCSAMLALPATCPAQPYVAHWNPTAPGISYGFVAGLTRVTGSPAPLQDFTVAAQLTARNDRGVDQWAFGVAAEAWAMPGSRSILIGMESAVINEEASNLQFKVANSAVFKNRRDGAPDPGEPMNGNSIAYWTTAQPGTGFERGLVFDRGSLFTGGNQRPAAIDLSDLSDEEIARVDLIRIRRDVVLRYDPSTRQLSLVTNGS